ncbi:HAD-IB family hydrolase [Phenylobacterium immobile]|uniref:HAD-IB family hydrolase n=1 Tax=Phenylobacterium immobile TaxID=21 RepID=UPI000AC0111D|nr:HAD-IB family hydrolase [Phenylobacterium immobile]
MPQDQVDPAEGAGDGRPIVAFDFDGTITVSDSFTAFLRWRAGPARYALGMTRLAPAALGYVVNKDRGRIKARATAEFLKGARRSQLEAEASRFAAEVSGAFIRPDAALAWRRWREQPVRLVIVTASPGFVVAPFARGLGADHLISTEMAYDADDRATGAFATPNCRGEEKVKRLRAAFGPDVEIRAAYGDTDGDRAMLAVATEVAGFRVFNGRP